MISDAPPSTSKASPALLDLRKLFDRPWEGEARLWQPWWLWWSPAPRRFNYRTEIENPAEDSWDVVDTSTFPNGKVQIRRMHCQVVAPDRLRLTAKDMPRATEVHVGSGGFYFDPFVIRTPVFGPLRWPICYYDRVQVQPDGSMIAAMELQFFGLRIGAIVIHLHRT